MPGTHKRMLISPIAPAATSELAISHPATMQEMAGISSHWNIQAIIGLPYRAIPGTHMIGISIITP